MHTFFSRGLLVVVLLSLLAAGCGPSMRTPAATVKPGQLQASESLDQSALGCNDPTEEAEILVVDLPASRRGDIEVLMQDGLIAVSYDCNQLKLLRGCQIPGSYAYKGTLLREEVLSLENGDEIRANLPLSGAGVAAKMEGAMERGATLDLATVMVGQQRAARYEVGRDELSGRCDGATHFVQSIYVGAFAMRRGERAKLAAAAEVFGAGGAAGSSSDSSLQNTDGDLEACRRTQASAQAPEAGCGTPLRLYMLPISEAGSALKPPPQEQDVVRIPQCPEGMARQGGKCVKASSGPVCGPEAPQACAEPCQKGDGLACGVYGIAQLRGEGLAKDPSAASVSLSRGCELGHGLSCFYQSVQYREGAGVSRDATRSAELAQRGCALGDGRACFLAGLSYMDGDGVEVDESKGFAAYEQGCAAGDASSCTNLGKAYSTGKGVESDVVYSFKLYLRACEAGSAQGCYNVGSRYSKGKGTEQSDQKRLQYYLRACKLDHGKGCYHAGETLQDASLMQRACELGYEKGCGQ